MPATAVVVRLVSWPINAAAAAAVIWFGIQSTESSKQTHSPVCSSWFWGLFSRGGSPPPPPLPPSAPHRSAQGSVVSVLYPAVACVIAQVSCSLGPMMWSNALFGILMPISATAFSLSNGGMACRSSEVTLRVSQATSRYRNGWTSRPGTAVRALSMSFGAGATDRYSW